MHAPHSSKCGTNRTQAHPHHTNSALFALISHSHSPQALLHRFWPYFTTPFTKKCRTSIYACIPQFQVWYQSNPGTSPPYQTLYFLHSFHIRTHHKHFYTDFAEISRPPSQKSAGPAYMYAPHNSKCGTSRTQAHPHNTKQCTFCTHFTFALTISTYTPIWLKFLDPFTKKCRTSIYACTPQFQVWYQSNPGTSPPYKTVHFLHSFHIRTHHKHLYTDFAKISRTPSQKKCRTSIYVCTPQFQVWYQSNPGTSPQ